MSQVTQPRIPISQQVRAHRAAVIAALLALGATLAVVLVLAIGENSSGTTAEPVAPGAQQSLRPDGGPEESGVAASVGAPTTPTGPDESRTAASISGR